MIEIEIMTLLSLSCIICLVKENNSLLICLRKKKYIKKQF